MFARTNAWRLATLLCAVMVVAGACSGGGGTIHAGAQRIVFTSARDGTDRIFIMDADGANQRSLTAGALEGTGDGIPACSTDGEQIAFFRRGGDGLASIWVVDADGSEETQLLSTAVGAISPRGFTPWQGFRDRADWSPDGSRIVYSLVPGLASSTAAFDVGRPSESFEVMNNISGLLPAWSPDGSKIAFGGGDIYVADSGGSGQPDRLTRDAFRDEAPDWSPDGSRIVFESAGRDGKFDSDIFVMNSDGSGLTRLTTDPGQDGWPSWSPDGGKIAFHSQRNGSDWDIYEMNADGSGQMALTDNDVDDGHPCWLA